LELDVGTLKIAGVKWKQQWTPVDRRLSPMKIEKVLAVYKVSPPLLVVESEGDMLFELSLKELKGAGHSCSDAVWKTLIEDYQILRVLPQ